jgi:hypothetical protein
MKKKSQIGISATALVALMGSTSFASTSDDWLMFRRDSTRSAASSAKIALPLEQAWTWEGQKTKGTPALSTVVVRDGVAYFTTGSKEGSKKEADGRLLVAIDAATGDLKWSQGLASPRLHRFLPEDIGPSAADGGTVFAVDLVTIYNPCPQTFYVVKAFDGQDGSLQDWKALPYRNDLGRLFLRERDGRPHYFLPPPSKPPT